MAGATELKTDNNQRVGGLSANIIPAITSV